MSRRTTIDERTRADGQPENITSSPTLTGGEDITNLKVTVILRVVASCWISRHATLVAGPAALLSEPAVGWRRHVTLQQVRQRRGCCWPSPGGSQCAVQSCDSRRPSAVFSVALSHETPSGCTRRHTRHLAASLSLPLRPASDQWRF